MKISNLLIAILLLITTSSVNAAIIQVNLTYSGGGVTGGGYLKFDDTLLATPTGNHGGNMNVPNFITDFYLNLNVTFVDGSSTVIHSVSNSIFNLDNLGGVYIGFGTSNDWDDIGVLDFYPYFAPDGPNNAGFGKNNDDLYLGPNGADPFALVVCWTNVQGPTNFGCGSNAQAQPASYSAEQQAASGSFTTVPAPPSLWLIALVIVGLASRKYLRN